MPNPRCRAKDCPAAATHILLTHSWTWTRLALLADQAPDVVAATIATRTDTTPFEHAKPTPYLCQRHAEEKATHA